MATRRIGLNGSSSHIAFDAEKRKISFPLLTTTNVWKKRVIRSRRRAIILIYRIIVRYRTNGRAGLLTSTLLQYGSISSRGVEANSGGKLPCNRTGIGTPCSSVGSGCGPSSSSSSSYRICCQTFVVPTFVMKNREQKSCAHRHISKQIYRYTS